MFRPMRLLLSGRQLLNIMLICPTLNNIQNKIVLLFWRDITTAHNHQHHNMANYFGLLQTIFRSIFSSRWYNRCAYTGNYIQANIFQQTVHSVSLYWKISSGQYFPVEGSFGVPLLEKYSGQYFPVESKIGLPLLENICKPIFSSRE